MTAGPRTPQSISLVSVFTKQDLATLLRYGTYEIYSADTTAQKYQFVTFINETAQDSANLFPQFMYESVMKVATKNSDFKFKTRLTPYTPMKAL